MKAKFLIIVGMTMGALWGFKRAPVKSDILDIPADFQTYSGINKSNRHDVFPLDINITYIDSSRSQYTFWTQIPDPVHYGENGDTVVFVWRGYEVSGTGLLAIAMTTEEGNTWYVIRKLDEQTGVHEGGARYPSASRQGGYAVAGFPQLGIPIDWGYMADVSGPFTADTSQWCGNRTSDIDAHKCLPMRLPDNIHVLNLGSSAIQGFVYSRYNVIDCIMDSVFVVDPGFDLIGGDYLGDTIMAFGVNSEGSPAAYVYDADVGIWTGQITLHTPGIDTLSNGEILNTIWWGDGIILNDGTPIMAVDVGDGTGTDTVAAGRAVWVLRPDTAVRVWIAPNPDPINHVIYSQLSVDRNTGMVYLFWEKLDEWHGDTTGYGTWDIWYSYSTDNGFTWSEPVNLSNTTGVDEAMFQVAKRVVNGRAWLAFLRPMNNRVIDLYWQVLTDYGDGVTPVYVYLGYATVVSVQEKNATFPENAGILGNGTLRLTLNKPGRIALKIFDITGRLITSSVLNVSKGTNLIDLGDYGLQPGIYFLRLKIYRNHNLTLRYIKPSR